MYTFACIAMLLRYPYSQIARVWFRQMREIAKVRLAGVEAATSVAPNADLILVPAAVAALRT
jgi:hypothetical protein